MKVFVSFLVAMSMGLFANAQCNSVSIVVSASDTFFVQLYHPGFFLIPSGDSNVCDWEVSTFDGELIHEETTTGNFSEQGTLLFDHSVPITDSLMVNLVITNEVEGITCTVNDTLYWEEIEILPGEFIGNWAILSNNGGVEEVISNTYEWPDITNNAVLFPVPVKNELNILAVQHLSDYALLNSVGTVVRKGSLESENTSIDLSDISSGIYFIRLYGSEGTNQSIHRIVKE